MNIIEISFATFAVVGVLGIIGIATVVTGRAPKSFNWKKNVEKKALKDDKSKSNFLEPDLPKGESESTQEVESTIEVTADQTVKLEEKEVFEEISEEEAGITRRQFLTKALRISFGAFAGIQLISYLGFFWPKISGGFGSKVDAGTVAEGLVAVYQRCVHLGCRVPWCNSSQGFECPCHGSKYNMVGEYFAGPAPRNLDRFNVSVVSGRFIIDTGTIIESPRAPELSVKYPQGLSCIALTTEE